MSLMNSTSETVKKRLSDWNPAGEEKRFRRINEESILRWVEWCWATEQRTKDILR